MGRIHLVVGPVGAGKSTYARRLAVEHQAVRLALDEWMVGLFRPDRPNEGVVPWYVERAERCVEQIWNVTDEVLRVGTDVVLEIGLTRRRERDRFFARVDAGALACTVHVLEADREVRWARVERRNRERGETFSMEVPREFFDLASDGWEPLDEAETDGRDVRWVRTD